MPETTLYLDNNKKPCLTITEHGKEEDFIIYPLICDNPLCPCTEIDLTLIALDGPCESFRFVLDIKTMKPIAGYEINESSRIIMERIIAGSSNKFWDQLGWLFYRERYPISDSFIPEHDDFTLPVVELGKKVLYRAIVPHAETLLISLKPSNFAMCDYYCPNPECTCNTVLLEFLDYNKSSGVITRHSWNPSVSLHLENLTTDIPEETIIESKLLETVLKNKRMISRFRKRFDTIRYLYAHKPEFLVKKKEKAALENPAVPIGQIPNLEGVVTEPGRNDPCPCGSGKKFKKCCMW